MLAMMFAAKMNRFAFNNLRIDATDVESTGQFARMIEAAVYPGDELSRIPDGILAQYFEAADQPGHYRVIDNIRRRIAFQQHDLLSLKEIGQGYSLVLCKNVLLHFQALERIEVLRMFHRALAPGGLFASEHTQEIVDGGIKRQHAKFSLAGGTRRRYDLPCANCSSPLWTESPWMSVAAKMARGARGHPQSANAGMDQAHEQIAHAGAVQRLIEEGVLTIQNGFLQGALDDVIGEGRQLHRMATMPIPFLKSSTHTIR
jgi:hypothetical protein